MIDLEVLLAQQNTSAKSIFSIDVERLVFEEATKKRLSREDAIKIYASAVTKNSPTCLNREQHKIWSSLKPLLHSHRRNTEDFADPDELCVLADSAPASANKTKKTATTAAEPLRPKKKRSPSSYNSCARTSLAGGSSPKRARTLSAGSISTSPAFSELKKNSRATNSSITNEDVWIEAGGGSGRTFLLSVRICYCVIFEIPFLSGSFAGTSASHLLCATALRSLFEMNLDGISQLAKNSAKVAYFKTTVVFFWGELPSLHSDAAQEMRSTQHSPVSPASSNSHSSSSFLTPQNLFRNVRTIGAGDRKQILPILKGNDLSDLLQYLSAVLPFWAPRYVYSLSAGMRFGALIRQSFVSWLSSFGTGLLSDKNGMVAIPTKFFPLSRRIYVDDELSDDDRYGPTKNLFCFPSKEALSASPGFLRDQEALKTLARNATSAYIAPTNTQVDRFSYCAHECLPGELYINYSKTIIEGAECYNSTRIQNYQRDWLKLHPRQFRHT